MNIDRLIKRIDWYFNASASAMGISSGYYAMVNGSKSSNSGVNHESIINFLQSIRKHRKIHAAICELDPSEFRDLSAIYDDTYKNKYPPAIKTVLNGKTGLFLCMTFDLQKMLDLCTKHRQKSLNAQEEIYFNDLINKVNIRYDQ